MPHGSAVLPSCFVAFAILTGLSDSTLVGVDTSAEQALKKAVDPHAAHSRFHFTDPEMDFTFGSLMLGATVNHGREIGEAFFTTANIKKEMPPAGGNNGSRPPAWWRPGANTSAWKSSGKPSSAWRIWPAPGKI